MVWDDELTLPILEGDLGWDDFNVVDFLSLIDLFKSDCIVE